MRRDHYYIIAIVILLGAGFFGGGYYRKENRELKRDSKAKEEMIQAYQKANVKLKEQVAERDSFIVKTTGELTALKCELQDINNKGIVTNYETYSTVRNLSLDGHIQLLSDYLSAADSLGN